MNIFLALQWAIEHLRTSDSPNLDAEVLLSFALKKPKEFLYAHPEQKLTNLKLRTYKLLIARRAKHEPVAYLTGHKEFYGLDFKVSPAVLIPRPETELIIETLKHLNTKTLEQLSNTTFIDVGTGSGCLPIALATSLRAKRSNPIRFFATDISKSALEIAKKNAQRHGVTHRIKFLQGNLMEPIFKNSKFIVRNSEFIILANLPYLTTRQWRHAPPDVRLYEPRQALDAGPDGLKYFRQLFKQIKKLNILRPRRIRLGRKYLISNIFLEIECSQTAEIKKLMRQMFPAAEIQIKKDLAGRARVAVISRITCG